MSVLGNWILKTVDGDQIPGDVAVAFQEERLSYKYGNRHSHPFSVNGGSINIGKPASTRMGVQINPPEGFVTGAFQHSNQWKIEGNTLTLSQDGKPRATLQRA